MSSANLSVRIARSMTEIDADQWNACANPHQNAPVTAFEALDPQRERYNPFITHAFLKALEESGSATARAGWGPSHVLVEDEGMLIAAAPAYIKSHSMGEYVFDHSWADAYERAGGRYYPKIQVSVPFTPAQGRRLLVAPGERADVAEKALIAGLRALREKVGASSIHITFPLKSEWDALGESGFLKRTGKQFHFFNKGYGSFDDFLSDLASRKRKNIRKERAEAVKNGITIECLTGEDIREEHWDAFFAFYMDTGSRKWGRPYLTRQYYSLVSEAMADDILLVMAKRAGRYIAGAINFIGADALYGRNWGAVEEHPFLHFECCYYQAIEFALMRGLSRVEAGAQGEHKLARGYAPVETYSAHDIADPNFRRAVANYLEHERRDIAQAIEVYAGHVPFRKVAVEEPE
jgi:predicted N-acyltransferase